MGGVLAKNAGLFMNDAKYCARKECPCTVLYTKKRIEKWSKDTNKIEKHIRACKRSYELFNQQ